MNKKGTSVRKDVPYFIMLIKILQYSKLLFILFKPECQGLLCLWGVNTKR